MRLAPQPGGKKIDLVVPIPHETKEFQAPVFKRAAILQSPFDAKVRAGPAKAEDHQIESRHSVGNENLQRSVIRRHRRTHCQEN